MVGSYTKLPQLLPPILYSHLVPGSWSSTPSHRCSQKFTCLPCRCIQHQTKNNTAPTSIGVVYLDAADPHHLLLLPSRATTAPLSLSLSKANLAATGDSPHCCGLKPIVAACRRSLRDFMLKSAANSHMNIRYVEQLRRRRTPLAGCCARKNCVMLLCTPHNANLLNGSGICAPSEKIKTPRAFNTS